MSLSRSQSMSTGGLAVPAALEPVAGGGGPDIRWAGGKKLCSLRERL